MNAEEKSVLIAKANHAAPLRALTAKQWQAVEHRLEKSGLLLGKKGSFKLLEWDTHPIIRAYFGEKFKENHPENFKQAHCVLFDFYQELPEKEFPDTLEEMQPLYRAVVHGCLAKKYQKALEIYWNRILRKDEHYSWHKLRAYSHDLTALNSFFTLSWEKPVQTGLNESDQAWLLAEVSFLLMSLGRLQEAIEPREVNLIIRDKLADWKNASNTAQNLVEIYLPLGQLQVAKEIAHLAFDYAGKSEDIFEQIKAQIYVATLNYC